MHTVAQLLELARLPADLGRLPDAGPGAVVAAGGLVGLVRTVGHYRLVTDQTVADPTRTPRHS